MVFHTYKIELFTKDGTGSYVTTAQELTDILSISLSLGLGDSADSFSFTLNNFDDYQFQRISIDDRVKIYGCIDGSTYVLLMDGMIQEKTNSSGTDNKTISFSGLNRLEKLFNALVSTSGESNVQKIASYWIKNIIDQVNLFNNQGGTDRAIKYVYNGYDQDGNATTADDTISTTTLKISYTKGFEKAFSLIDELSQPDFTGDGSYIYFMDENNYFYWQPKTTTVTSEIDYGDEIKTHRTTMGMYEVINYLIMNCGKSCFGASILAMNYDVDSINKLGWKVKLVTRESIGNELRDKDLSLMKDKNVFSEDSVFPTAYPYVTTWGVSTASNTDYNSKFVDEVRTRGITEINAILNRTVGATYKSDVSVDTSFGYVLGDLHTLKIPDNYWDTPYEIRITSINYSFGTDGWKTDIKFDEDSEFQIS